MRKKKITESFAAKVCAFFLTVLFLCIAIAGVAVTLVLDQEGFYETSWENLRHSAMSQTVLEKGKEILYLLSSDLEEEATLYCQNTNLQYQVVDQNNKIRAGVPQAKQGAYIYTIYADEDAPLVLRMVAGTEVYRIGVYSREESGFLKDGWSMRLYVDKQLEEQDEFSRIGRWYGIFYTYRYLFLVIAAVAAVCCLLCFLFLLCAAGRRFGLDVVTAGGLYAVPFDLLTGAMICLAGLLLGILDELLPWSNMMEGIGTIVILLLGICMGIGYCLVGAIQGKAGIWWKNMVISRCLMGIRSCCLFAVKAVSALIRGLPDIIQVLIGLTSILIIEGILLLLMGMRTESVAWIWLLEKVLLIPCILYLALVISKLVKGSRSLADGNLNDQISTQYMAGILKEHGENLNCIAEGMNRAVEERLKSERLKTELITNVSHDIKTPLTSIINYAELITEEKSENEKITEYAQVLTRQSVRLKKLIEDLMEASKASTGNVEVHMVPCEVNVLLTQTIGEYEQRLEELGLELICRQPEMPVRIMADGKLLWRVFDNLMNNICKYALGGTRVYLTLEQTAEEAVISFKNISRYPLEISAEELQERFVRGDRSRHTEGNGLGLSISQSLTDLQNGKLQLTVDGDFFKVVLRFLLLEEDGDR